MAEDIRHLSIKGIKWSAVDGFLTHGITFVVGLIIARILSPEDYGIVGMLAIFLAVSQVLVNSGFSTALIRMTERKEDDYTTAFFFNLIVGITCYSILWLVAPAISSFYEIPILTDVLRVFALTLIISAIQIVPRTKLVVAVDFKTQTFVDTITALVSGCTGIWMAYSGFGVWALVWQSIISSIVGVILLWIVTGWKPWKGRIRRSSFNWLFTFGSRLLASSLLHILYKNISALIIGKYYTPADLGFYSRGQHIAEVPSTFLSNVFQGVSFPILAKLQNDEEKLAKAYRKYLGMSSMVIFFLMISLATVAEPLVRILLTEKWIGAVPFIRIFCLALIFDHICRFNNNMMFVKGRSDLFLKLEIIKKIIVFPILLLAIPHGVIAICFVPVIHELVDLIIGTFCVRKLLGIHYSNPLKDYGGYLILALLACTPAFFICYTHLSPFITLSSSFALSFFIYFFLLWRDDNMKELIKLMKNH